MNTQIARSEITPQAILEFYSSGQNTGTTCSLLTPMIKARLNEIASGQVLEVRVDDPSAREYILSWSRLSGNQVLEVVSEEPHILRFFLRKK